jgi:hypothetical protein
VNSSVIGELYRFNGAVGSLHGNRLSGGINFIESTGDDICLGLSRL